MAHELGASLALTGATSPTRYVGRHDGGAPTTGTFAVGDFTTDITTPAIWVCSVAGTPGTWVQAGGGGATGFYAPCRVAAVANLSLNGPATSDGIAVVTGDRVLVAGQTQTSNNGIYIANTAGPWTRATDFDTSAKINPGGTRGGGMVGVGDDGDFQYASIWVVSLGTTNFVLGTDVIGFDLLCGYEYISFVPAGDDAAMSLTISHLATPTLAQQATPKTYVDKLAMGTPAFRSLTTPPVTTTIYQNTTGYNLQASLKVTLAVNPVLASDCKVEISPDNFASAQVWADPGYAAGAVAVGSDPEYVTFPIPAGWYYKVTATNATIGALVAIG